MMHHTFATTPAAATPMKMDYSLSFALPTTTSTDAMPQIPYKKVDHTFKFWSRRLKSWIQDLIHDPALAPLFEWDAQKLSKFDGDSFVRFIDEPWTAQRFWDIQSRLPPDGKPFGIILYADKTKLSSFGTQMGYPVIARCANLPVEVRNGNGPGGGRVVGWLPLVPDDQKNKGKSHFADFKNVVWHECVRVLFESLKPDSRGNGFWVRCADGVDRHLFPFIVILSADYEEQCVMVLNRGFRGLWPCPKCYVPAGQLSDLHSSHKLRTGVETRDIVQKARKLEKKSDRDDMLKNHGLRGVDNAFWELPNSDPHLAVSWDKCHNLAHGLGGKHIWPILQQHVHDLGRVAADTINMQMRHMPRWRHLSHFQEGAIDLTFSDANKFEDILKTIIYASHNILTKAKSPSGYALLALLRQYLCLEMYASLEVHTEQTLSDGRLQLKLFVARLEEYIPLGPQDKSWNFPKLHMLQHLFDDIESKGVTRNYDTKPNESLHGPLKDSYQLRTNFRDVAGQILKADHQLYVASLIRQQIDDFDEQRKRREEAQKKLGAVGELEDATDSDDTNHPSQAASNAASLALSPTISVDNVTKFSVHSRKDACTFKQLEEENIPSSAGFVRFRLRLAEFLSQSLPAAGIRLPNDRYLNLRADDKIRPFQFLKSYYESKVSWRTEVDYIRCSPDFYHRPRHDFVIIQTDGLPVFAQLQLLFEFTLGDKTYPIALALPLDAARGSVPSSERELGLLRLRAWPSSETRFYFVNSIIRGACVIEKFGSLDRDFYVIDTIGTDMFLRIRELYPDTSWGAAQEASQ